MKIYFTASIHGKKKYQDYYERIVQDLQKLGHKVKADHILKRDWQYVEDVISSEERNKKYYQEMCRWIKTSDLVVAEASYPSANVGHEITLALEKGKPVIVLYSSNSRLHLLEALDSDILLVIKYDLNNLKIELKNAINFLSQKRNERFTLLLPPDIVSYLDEIAKSGQSRSEYIRKLIRKDRKRKEK